MVVPDGKHTAQHIRIVLFKNFVGNHCRSPVFIEILTVQIIVVITGLRHNIGQSVGDANHLVAQFLHVARLGIRIVPDVHHHIVHFDRSVALGMSQSAPNARLFAKLFYIFDVVIGKGTELFYHLLVLVGIFIGTDIHPLTTEHRIFAFEIFLEQTIHKLIGFGISELQMVHTIGLASDFGLIMCEGQGMSRRVDFGNDFHIIILGQNLQVDELLFGIETVLGCQARISVALQTESGIGLVPVVLKVLLETIVVQMNLEGIHLVVGHELHIIAQEINGEELTGYIEHESAHGIAREVTHTAFGQAAAV